MQVVHSEMGYLHFKKGYFAAKIHYLHFERRRLQKLPKVKNVKVRRPCDEENPAAAFRGRGGTGSVDRVLRVEVRPSLQPAAVANLHGGLEAS